MKILYLYAELMGYQIPILKEYTETYNAQVHVVHWDNKKLTPYIPPLINNVLYYNRSDYSIKKLKTLTKTIAPDIVYISGWQDKGYLYAAYYLKRKGIPIVAGFDDQWRGTLKQYIASLLFPLTLKRIFCNAWVAGPYQFEYARRLGFKKIDIIYNLLSGNTNIFSIGEALLKIKTKNYPKSFLYVGNFRKVKGTDILVEAYKIYKGKYNGTWNLTCIGNGEMLYMIENEPEITVLGYTLQEELIEISKYSGVYVLPSRLDQWGVVVHEFASLGMPLLLSENVGARALFLIDNYNGLIYKDNSAENLAKAMFQFSLKSDLELIEMGKRSFQLSLAINPSFCAANFLSILNK